MIRRISGVLLALPFAAGVLPAAAQNYPPPQPYYSSAPSSGITQQQLPPPGIPQTYRAQGQPGAPQRVLPYPDEEDAAIPPPGFAGSNGGAPPAYGHQFDQRQSQPPQSARTDDGVMRPPGSVGPSAAAPPVQATPPSNANANVMTLPPEDQPETGQPKVLPQNLRKQLVDFNTREPAGTIIIDTPHTYLYLVLGRGQAIRYGIGVGREGFTWAGTERISRMKEWPDWFPPPEMIERQPYLPRMMAGGEGNPLGARALYLGHTLYRIHGTNQPSTIGSFVSSGCIRLINQDIEDLYSRVQVGTRVVVMPGNNPPETAANTGNMPFPGNSSPVGARGPANTAPQGGTAVSGSSLPAMR
jgi:lipoprotein-anchoring transpeptidase ErfK/SrfK